VRQWKTSKGEKKLARNQKEKTVGKSQGKLAFVFIELYKTETMLQE
jgi:hypothetical protein